MFPSAGRNWSRRATLLSGSTGLWGLKRSAPSSIKRWRGRLGTEGSGQKARDKGGRPPFDAVLMFKILVLQALYNLADEQTEYQILDRLSCMKFLGLELHDDVPDARTIWLFRETLIAAAAVEKLVERFDAMLDAEGFQASGGQIIDATFVEAPRQRNGRDDTDATTPRRSRKAKFPPIGAPKRRRIRTPTRVGRRRTAWLFMATKTTSMSIARIS
jgi:hypothetical protein